MKSRSMLFDIELYFQNDGGFYFITDVLQVGSKVYEKAYDLHHSFERDFTVIKPTHASLSFQGLSKYLAYA